MVVVFRCLSIWPGGCTVHEGYLRQRGGLVSSAELKDIHAQFGAPLNIFRRCAELGMAAIIANMNHEKMSVVWDRSPENLTKMAERTSQFKDIPGVVGMLDGRKMLSRHPSDWLEQNRDYNGWTQDVNRNVVLMWDPAGEIVDVAVNTPGNFHDSKSSSWCRMYGHIEDFPDGFVAVCDSAFTTSRPLDGNLFKLKDEQFARTEYEKSLTALRKSSEWGNGVLCNAFRRLHNPLPTNNTRWGLIF